MFFCIAFLDVRSAEAASSQAAGLTQTERENRIGYSPCFAGYPSKRLYR